MGKQHINLSDADIVTLEALLSKGTLKARKYKRATALLELNRGKSYGMVGQTLGMTYQSISALGKRYKQQGLGCLEDQPRSGRPVEINGEVRAKITALACSDAPLGHAKWSLRLLANRVVELGWCEQISYGEVGNILKKTNCSPT